MSNHSATSGTIRSCTNWRTVSRNKRSSSESSASMSRKSTASAVMFPASHRPEIPPKSGRSRATFSAWPSPRHAPHPAATSTERRWRGRRRRCSTPPSPTWSRWCSRPIPTIRTATKPRRSTGGCGSAGAWSTAGGRSTSKTSRVATRWPTRRSTGSRRSTTERDHPYPDRHANAYPFAYEQIAQLFDADVRARPRRDAHRGAQLGGPRRPPRRARFDRRGAGPGAVHRGRRRGEAARHRAPWRASSSTWRRRCSR